MQTECCSGLTVLGSMTKCTPLSLPQQEKVIRPNAVGEALRYHKPVQTRVLPAKSARTECTNAGNKVEPCATANHQRVPDGQALPAKKSQQFDVPRTREPPPAPVPDEARDLPLDDRRRPEETGQCHTVLPFSRSTIEEGGCERRDGRAFHDSYCTGLAARSGSVFL